MDTVRFVEDLLDIKLLDYQKKMIEYFDKHPDCTIQIPRGRSTPSWIQAYYMCKTIDKKEQFYKAVTLMQSRVPCDLDPDGRGSHNLHRSVTAENGLNVGIKTGASPTAAF